MPDAEPTVATEVLLLLHVPPVVASPKVDVPPTQMFKLPVIEAGDANTVTTLDA
jgi:hypothetical protein